MMVPSAVFVKDADSDGCTWVSGASVTVAELSQLGPGQGGEDELRAGSRVCQAATVWVPCSAATA
jgi:hypothetical protein